MRHIFWGDKNKTLRQNKIQEKETLYSDFRREFRQYLHNVVLRPALYSTVNKIETKNDKALVLLLGYSKDKQRKVETSWRTFTFEAGLRIGIHPWPNATFRK